MRHILIVLACAFLAAVVTSCDEDRVTPPPSSTDEYKNLSEKDDILYNLELSYNKRRFDKYEELLDADFIFYFAEVDYNNPNGTPEQWGRVEEVGANSRLLSPSTPGDNKVVSIDLKLEYITDSWTEEPANAVHPDEPWYVMTFGYDLVSVTAADWQFKALDRSGEITVRWDADKGKWQIRLWKDEDGGPQMFRSSAAIEETTWGGIKSLYSG
jgi:hypothetical protein